MTNTTDQTPEILSCGHPSTPRGIAAGYAILPNGDKICYECADRLQREDVLVKPEIFAYVSSDGKTITTWSGGELMKVTQTGKSKSGWYGAEIHYIRATAPDGSNWYGKNGGTGMAIKMKRAKS